VTDAIGVGMRPLDDPPALLLSGLGQTTLADEECRLLLGPGDDPVGLLARALEDPLPLLVDPLGGPDLLRDRDAQLVDEAERRVLIDDDVVGEWQLLAVPDERLEALDEEDDVDGSRPSALGPTGAGHRTPSAESSVALAAGGSIADTSPPNRAISLTRLELT
jgi:hypothetical protein